MSLVRVAGSAVLALVLAGSPALAQLPPYAERMERLAEILGSLHYLTELCDDAPSLWRDAMEALLADENPAEAFRVRFIDRFNLGFSSFAAVYQRCTPAALLAIDRYRTEGAALATAIATEFGLATTPE